MLGEFKLKDGRAVNIKRLTKSDYQRNNNYEFVHIWIRTVSKYLNFEFKAENLERDRRVFYDQFIENENEIFFGALFNDQIIASADLRLNPKIEKRAHVGEWGITIHPDFHNQGIGTRLLTIIENYAKNIGLEKLQAAYYSKNMKAESLYLKKLKYTIEGTRKSAIKYSDGTYDDEILIGKLIK